jgi:dienelactone hydrolase
MGETIAFGSTTGYLATPEKGAGPAVIVIGRRDQCDDFAEEGFTALAPDLQNGHTAEALGAAIDLLKPHPAVRGHGVGVVGYSAGAGLALRLASQRPDDVVACAAVEGNFGDNEPHHPPDLCVEFLTANPEDDERLIWIRTLEFLRKHLG